MSGTVALTWSPEEVTDGLARERPCPVPRPCGAPRWRHRRSRTPLQVPQRHAGAGVEHQRHCGTAALPRARRWPAGRCRPCSAPAPGSVRRPATARSRPVPPAPGPGRVPGLPWRPARRRRGSRASRASGSRSCSKLSAVLRTRATVRRITVRSASTGRAQPELDQPLRLGAAGVAGQQAPGAFLPGAEQQDLAGVRVRGTLLDVEVIAVVPADHETEVLHGRVGGGAGAQRPRRRR